MIPYGITFQSLCHIKDDVFRKGVSGTAVQPDLAQNLPRPTQSPETRSGHRPSTLGKSPLGWASRLQAMEEVVAQALLLKSFLLGDCIGTPDWALSLRGWETVPCFS